MVNFGKPRFKGNQKYNTRRANDNMNKHKKINTVNQRGGIKL